MNIRYPIYEGVYRILTIHFTSVFDQFKGYPYTNIFHHEGCNIRPVQP